MSWNFNAVGKPASVARKAAEDLDRIRCYEPEQTIKAKVIEIIATALGAYPADAAVRIEAYGSQNTGASENAVNQLSVKIEPLYGFVE